MLIVVVGAVVWFACGLIAAAAYFAYFQREWPELAAQDYALDRRIALALGLVGPISLVVVWMTGSFRHGLKWR